MWKTSSFYNVYDSIVTLNNLFQIIFQGFLGTILRGLSENAYLARVFKF